jgi:hypothetical protein
MSLRGTLAELCMQAVAQSLRDLVRIIDPMYVTC